MGEDPELPEVEYDVASNDQTVPPGDRKTSTAVIVTAVLAGLVVLWLVSGLGSGPADTATLPEIEPAAEVVLVVPSPVPTPTATPTLVPTPLPTPDTQFVDTRAAQIARSQLANLGPSHAVVYATSDGLGVLVLSTAESYVLALNPGEVSGQTLVVPDEVARYGFGPADLGLVSRAATGDLVATGFDEGTLSFVNANRTAMSLVDTDTGTLIAEHLLRSDAELVALDGYGVTVYGVGRGTFVARRSGMSQITEGELLDGNQAAWLERRCANSCQVLLVDRVTGDTHELPSSFVVPFSRYLISPNAEYVLRIGDDGSGELYEPASGSVLLVGSDGIGDIAWSPDSSFVAWIDYTDEPELRLLLPKRRDLVVARLALLGVPEPIPGELRVLLTAD